MSKQHRKNKKSFFGRPVWRNSTKTITVTPQRYYQPETMQDVLEMVQEGIDTATPVRAVGSGHSFSSAPKTDGILMDTDKLNMLNPYKFTNKKGYYFEAQGGIKLREFNSKLDDLGFCIRTMGGIDHQSIAGAISTGTHGSSLTFGAMSQMVKSIVIVTHDLNDPKKAKAYRIEGEGQKAFTDPANYEGPELLQNDDFFNSAVVCFGALGIIISYVLEVDTMYYLSEKKEVMEWHSVKQQLKDRTIFHGHESVFIQLNPYKYEGLQKALVIYHNRHNDSDKNLLLETIKHKFWHRIKRSMRSLQFVLASLIPYVVVFVRWRINTFPDYVPKFLNSAIKSQRDEEFFNKGYKVMYQGLDYVKERAIDSEIVLPIDEDGKYLDTLDDLMTYLQFLQKEYKIHLTSPVGLRFIKSSDAFLTPECGKDVCYIDTPVLQKIYGGDTIISRIQKFMLDKHAILHWGKLNQHMDVDYVKDHYMRFDDFVSVMKKFNPSKIFSNDFTKRVIGY